MRSSRLLAVLSVVGLWASATAAASLNPEDAAGHMGETATVSGVVASAEYEVNVQLQPTLFGPREVVPERALHCGDLRRSPREIRDPRDHTPWQSHLWTGKISDYQAKPEIVLTDPSQLSQ